MHLLPANEGHQARTPTTQEKNRGNKKNKLGPYQRQIGIALEGIKKNPAVIAALILCALGAGDGTATEARLAGSKGIKKREESPETLMPNRRKARETMLNVSGGSRSGVGGRLFVFNTMRLAGNHRAGGHLAITAFKWYNIFVFVSCVLSAFRFNFKGTLSETWHH